MANRYPNALADWRDIEGAHRWQGILVGNGASRAIWDRFSYASLFEVACEPELPNGLADGDRQLFEALNVSANFEAVLNALLTSAVVCDALRVTVPQITARYRSIRNALVAAVHEVHVPWNAVPTDTLRALCEQLRCYEFVFSTNYDLLIYWAIMQDPDRFRDYFWDTRFDVGNTEIWGGDVTRVLYLHGALHLYHAVESGGTFKERAEEFANLLERFGRRNDAVPLCITEGTPRQKIAAISRSDYLTFALQQFSHFRGPMVILGQGLGDSDTHLAEIIGKHRDRIIAVGIYPGDGRHMVRETARYRQILPEANLLYFNSTTHPLALPGYRIEP